MEKIVNIQNIDSNTFQLQNYSVDDESLISNFTEQDIVFDPTEDYIEYFVFDLNKNILLSIDNYPNYKLRDNLVTIDPQNDLESQGYTEGQYYTLYNFLKRKLFSSPSETLYIQDISTDRTELRLNTTTIFNTNLVTSTNELAENIKNNTGTYLDFYLNFGNNKLIIANNIFLDNTNPNDPTVLIKLYEPLPSEFTTNSQCWVVEQVAESQAYQIGLTITFSLEEQYDYISGPNFNINIQDQINNSTSYINQNSLKQTTALLGSGSLQYQINSILAEKGIEINIDYSDYSQFVHFSSAQTRLENFYYKLSLIEQYNLNSSYSTNGILPLNHYTSGSQIVWQNKINDIITNFDGYEYYLYYESGSNAWPKTNSEPPYINCTTTSVQGTTWLADQISSASLYDLENKDNLINSIPTYLREDDTNEQYFLFTQMIGQNFDNVWVYLKDITNKFDADNRLNYGISKDIVAQAIRDLGIKIYQNNFSSDNLYSALLGITPSGSLFNIPYVTGSLPTPTGFEYVNTFVTASASSSLEPVDDVNKEIYKRIYHNLPMLLKKKGTAEGLRMLVNVYGIPDTILRINEFGGKSTSPQAYDNFVDQFNYYAQFQPGAYLETAIGKNEILLPYKTIAFRFKPSGIPTQSLSQSLARVISLNPGSTPAPDNNITVTFEYTPIPTGSYSGSIESPYNTYGTVKLYDSSSNQSCSVYLPIFDGNWWSVMVTQDFSYPSATNTSSLYVANKIYTGYDGSQVGFIASASILGGEGWGSGESYFRLSNPTNLTQVGKTYEPFDGGFQELRFYTEKINKDVFEEFVMNPYSIRGNTQTSSYDSITFRAPLGTTLDYISGSGLYTSSHPAITGSNPVTQSFNSNAWPGLSSLSEYMLIGDYEFIPQSEVIYQDQFVSGIKNSVSEKIRIVDMVLPSGSTLSPYISIQQQSPINETFTKDVNYVEAAFSPQDEINDDIISQLGSFNIGSYIGDPRQLISGSLNYYPDFNRLRDDYFKKYIHNYDLNDYVRLIKFFDNSLFKMIKDFTPARAGLASGIVIKPTLLERCRYPQPKVNTNSTIAFVGSPTTKTINISY